MIVWLLLEVSSALSASNNEIPFFLFMNVMAFIFLFLHSVIQRTLHRDISSPANRGNILSALAFVIDDNIPLSPRPFLPQSSPLPYYTFYYDTGLSDEEGLEEQVLRNTVNSEALMTAFHLGQTGSNGTKVQRRVPLASQRGAVMSRWHKVSVCGCSRAPSS